jgi:hypothetical protein
VASDLAEWEYDDGDYVLTVEVLTSARAVLVLSCSDTPTEPLARILIGPETAQELADAVGRALRWGDDPPP